MTVSRSSGRQYIIWASALSLATLVAIPMITRLRERRRKNRRKDARVPLNSIPALPLFHQARKYAMNYPDKIAVIDTTKGQKFTYGQLLEDAAALKKVILERLDLRNTGDLEERRIAFLAPNGYDYAVSMWAIWAAGGVCVPLCRSFQVICNWDRANPCRDRYDSPSEGNAIYNWRLGPIIDNPPPDVRKTRDTAT